MEVSGDREVEVAVWVVVFWVTRTWTLGGRVVLVFACGRVRAVVRVRVLVWVSVAMRRFTAVEVWVVEIVTGGLEMVGETGKRKPQVQVVHWQPYGES